ncbi:extracellular solute-binding protein [Oxalobacteraceae bacterium CAVE-383]|nr:extracellular solute-binding protein [Oxalobacteraceae bacterium CAVE-383]
MFSRKRAILSFIFSNCFACAAFAPGESALAQTPSTAATNSSGPAGYTGAERQQRLMEGAKKEGELMVYTSIQAPDFADVAAAFEKKYGVKIKVWRSSSENILQRAVSEGRAGRYDADVVETSGPELESLHREKMLQAVASPYLGDLIEQAIPPHREWIGTRLDIFTFAYNTKLVKPEDLPKTYEDLLDPKWKGKLAIEADDSDWFASIVTQLGEAKGIKLFRDIVAVNGISVRKGHTLLTNMVASGEVPLALDVYNYKVEQMKKQGVPVDWFAITPAIAAPQAVAMFRHAPHPNAAVLFFDFMLSDAQPILQKHHFVMSGKKMMTPLSDMPLKFIDSKVTLDENDKWSKLFEEIFIKHAAK